MSTYFLIIIYTVSFKCILAENNIWIIEKEVLGINSLLKNKKFMKNKIDSYFAVAILALVAACVGFAL